MELKIINPLKDERWDQFVISHPKSSIFHTSGWAKILCDSFKYEPFYLVSERNKVIKAGLPFMSINSWLTGKRLVSLPRTPYCDPLIDSPSDLSALLKHAGKMVRDFKYDYFEMKTRFDLKNNQDLNWQHYKFFKNHVIWLSQEKDDLWKSFHRTCTRQRILKAQKKNVKIRFGIGENELNIFYLLYKKTIRKHKVPGRPFSFFKNIISCLKKEEFLILIAEIHNLPIAASLSFKFQDTWSYEFVGLDYDFLDYSAGHLLIWEAINLAYEANLRFFDFGLTPAENKGLNAFKRHWSAKEADLFYSYYPDVKGYKNAQLRTDKVKNKKNQLFPAILQKTELTFAKILSKNFG